MGSLPGGRGWAIVMLINLPFMSSSCCCGTETLNLPRLHPPGGKSDFVSPLKYPCVPPLLLVLCSSCLKYYHTEGGQSLPPILLLSGIPLPHTRMIPVVRSPEEYARPGTGHSITDNQKIWSVGDCCSILSGRGISHSPLQNAKLVNIGVNGRNRLQ